MCMRDVRTKSCDKIPAKQTCTNIFKQYSSCIQNVHHQLWLALAVPSSCSLSAHRWRTPSFSLGQHELFILLSLSVVCIFLTHPVYNSLSLSPYTGSLGHTGYCVVTHAVSFPLAVSTATANSHWLSHGGIARLSWSGWLVKYHDSLPSNNRILSYLTLSNFVDLSTAVTAKSNRCLYRLNFNSSTG